MDQEIKRLEEYLFSNNFNFYRFFKILYSSNIIAAELLKLKRTDVDLKNKKFTVRIQTGPIRQKREIEIADDVLLIFEELLAKCDVGDYVFGYNLQPGPYGESPQQVSKRWNRLLKKELDLELPFSIIKNYRDSSYCN